MTFRLKNKKQLTNYIAKRGDLIEKALIFNLEFLVTELQNHAKESAEYEDRTSNLKSSIGGVLLKDRKPITYKGFVNQGTADTGDITGLEFINSKIAEMENGYVIVVVAGMEYASYVENEHNLNVLKKTELKMNRELPRMLKRLKRSIK